MRVVGLKRLKDLLEDMPISVEINVVSTIFESKESNDIDGSKEIMVVDEISELKEVIPVQGICMAKNVTGPGTRNYSLYYPSEKYILEPNVMNGMKFPR